MRRVLGRDAAEEAPQDDARAIRGRFFIYRYDESQRIPRRPSESTAPENPEAPPAGGVENDTHSPPALSLPPVDPSVQDGEWRLVSEVTLSLTTPEYGPLNWRALVDVQTDSVLYLEPLVASLNGMVFLRDPITSTGNAANTPNQSNSVLNPLRNSVELPNLAAPVNGVQSLRGRFAIVVNVRPPEHRSPTTGQPEKHSITTSAPMTLPPSTPTIILTASSRWSESLGFPINVYFNNTTFPLTVDHRQCGDTINAHCGGNGVGGIGHAGYALNDLSNTTNPIGRACDSRVHLHELGGHGILFEHVGSRRFGFAHSAGDSMSAILHDPDSRAPDRFRYAPWNPQNMRRFDRTGGGRMGLGGKPG